jgi:hypothetical protein
VTLRDLAGRLGRAQGTLFFKVAASIILTVAAIGGVGAYTVAVKADQAAGQAVVAPQTEEPAARQAESSGGAMAGRAEQVNPEIARREAADEITARAIKAILDRRADPTAIAVGAAVALGICLIIVWLGVGLTYLGLALIASLAVVPMTVWFGDAYVFGPPEPGSGADALRWGDVGRFLGGIVALTASFSALMQGLRLAFDAGGAAGVLGVSRVAPILAIARNVVAEAVRMKVSLVFIVLLVFALAALPGMLNETTPLRYRVQSFLQYGAGGSFWIIALLVLFLSVGTVAFEQRDRVIWQTMTKPVAPWQYLLGKWLGVSGVAAVLLAVAASGVFLFTEYLRNTPALGESAPYVSKSGTGLTEDRRVLEEQVLAARRIALPILETITPQDRENEIQRRIAAEATMSPEILDSPRILEQLRARFAEEIDKEVATAARTIEPGDYRIFRFEGLSRARQTARLLTLRYRVQSGGNDPRDMFRISVSIAGGPPVPISAHLEQTLILDISTAAIADDGSLEIAILNGEIIMDRGENQGALIPGPATVHFPPDGLELFYSDGSYRANFFRVALILWMKLAFIAMVGVCAATFLSFPVASLVAAGIFLVAEGARFLGGSLEYFGGEWDDPKFELWRFIVRLIAQPLAYAFRFYADLRPTTTLVEGRLVTWLAVGRAAFLLGALTFALYAIGVAIFRRRELATYSGQ